MRINPAHETLQKEPRRIPVPVSAAGRRGSPTKGGRTSPHFRTGRRSMANLDLSLKECMSIDGAVGVALVDYTSGMTLGTAGGSAELDLSVAAAGNTDVVRAKMRT